MRLPSTGAEQKPRAHRALRPPLKAMGEAHGRLPRASRRGGRVCAGLAEGNDLRARREQGHRAGVAGTAKYRVHPLLPGNS